MAIIRHDSAAAFLAATEDFRAADPLLTNIMGSVATASSTAASTTPSCG